MIRDARPVDAEAIASIYNYYVVHTPVTFEEEPVTASQMAVRIDDVIATSLPWIVLERDSIIVGYATLQNGKRAVRIASRSSRRCIWRGMLLGKDSEHISITHL